MLTRQEIRAVYSQGPEAVVALVEALQSQIVALEQKQQQMAERLHQLERRINQDSSNSHQPPSSDGPRRGQKGSARQPAARQAGGQAGHEGQTLDWYDTPDAIVRYEPASCQACGERLGAVDGAVAARRQEVEIPQPRVVVTEHQAIEKRCPTCGCASQGALPPHLRGRVQYGARLRALSVYLLIHQLLPYERTADLLDTLYGVRPGGGTLYACLAECYELLAQPEAAIRAAIRASPVIHGDETGVRIGGHTRWLHVLGTPALTLYHPDKARGRAAHEVMSILPTFSGVAVHDAYAAYLTHPCRHALCNAHLLRDLQAIVDADPSQRWAARLQQLLRLTYRLVLRAKRAGKTSLEGALLRRLVRLYDHICGRAHRLHPPAPKRAGRGRTKQTAERNLIDRLLTHKVATLRFAHDFAVPFDNNLAERDLRMVKVQQKIAGCFRTWQGAEMFCRIRGYMATLRKQGYELLPALMTVFHGSPLIPFPAE